jgi:FAD/FMN-containing dehydrogenase
MPSRDALHADLPDALSAIVGPSQVLDDPDLRAPFEQDWTRRFGGPARLVVRPGSTQEVASVLQACVTRGVAVVTQGGNTGLVGGSVPPASSSGAPAPVLLSTSRLTRFDAVDLTASQVTVGAGVTLGHLQSAAGQAGLTFAVDLAARDSATVGGMIATNAGGLHVLRYGPMRTQVVGVEAVLASGTIISRLNGLLKDNTGYDLSQLLVGSEGTLGIVTAARLKLVPQHHQRVVVLLGLPDTAAALVVVEAVRRRMEGLQAAEIFYEDGLDLVRAHGGLASPLPRPWPAYLVLEVAGPEDPSDSMFAVLAELNVADDASAIGLDAVTQDRLWAYRERHTEAISALGVPHKLDVTLPPGRLAEFEQAVRRVVSDTAPGSTLVLFGHVGDGNLHVNVVGPDPSDESVDDAVLKLVASMDGSISAEHGIGRAKTGWLHLSRSPEEIAVMRSLKRALDPDGLLNPGVLFGASG